MCCPDESIAKMDQSMAIVCLVLNILIPGIGTMINACYHEKPAAGVCYGILQLLTCWIIVGWIWAIVYGVKIMEKANLPG
mmetsp:Transcript_25619/g.24913  ORF Transcript_25619/g.24913 Transcript_25619/m.24913 type:complete len:80 (+) Transcript_25619:2-241(+)